MLFSNTQRAHPLGKTDDWAVIFYEMDGHEDQCTVVTEHRGSFERKRVIRGRKDGCWEYTNEQLVMQKDPLRSR